MELHIIRTVPVHGEIVHQITDATIRNVYPKYYPCGAVAFFLAHHRIENILRDITEHNVFLLYDPDKTPVGTVTLKGNEICRLFVLPAHQGKGYGRVLLDYAESMISARYRSVILDASLPAKGIYRKRGYVSVDYHEIVTECGDVLCYDVMQKNM